MTSRSFVEVVGHQRGVLNHEVHDQDIEAQGEMLLQAGRMKQVYSRVV